MNKCAIITISGRVQGVGFRYFLLRQAQALDIKGLAKNISLGQVYVEAEGSQEMLELFIEQCKQGPVRARVESIEIQWCPEQGFSEFRIR